MGVTFLQSATASAQPSASDSKLPSIAHRLPDCRAPPSQLGRQAKNGRRDGDHAVPMNRPVNAKAADRIFTKDSRGYQSLPTINHCTGAIGNDVVIFTRISRLGAPRGDRE